ncbi:MAG: hypothetical protein ABWZ98_18505 [Nakamurella sp.]
MTSAADAPVESGQAYTIIDVEGRPPESLDDFAGDVHIKLVRNGHLLQVVGSCSAPAADEVRFYQKDLALHDRDIRVWTITQLVDATFLAAPNSAY